MALLNHHRDNVRMRPEPAWLRERRRAAWQRFQKLADPVFRYGQGIGFDRAAIRLPYAQQRGGRVPAATAGAAQYPAALKQCLGAFPVADLDKIWSWHEATAPRIRFISTAPKEHPGEPVRLETKLAAGKLVREASVIAAAPGSELAVIERISGSGDRVASTLVDAGDNAKVTIISIRDLGDRSTEFVRREARLGRNAEVVWLECLLGGSYASTSTVNRLAGRGAKAVARTIFGSGSRARLDIVQTALHQAGATSSDLLARGVLTDAAKAVYRGRINVGRGLPGCEAHQKEDTLLLGERAESSAVPVLEIATDEIKCGHGCTVGRLDRDRLFYLMSRGLDERTSTKLLVDGFFQPVIAGMQRYGLEEMVSCLIAGQLAAEKSLLCL